MCSWACMPRHPRSCWVADTLDQLAASDPQQRSSSNSIALRAYRSSRLRNCWGSPPELATAIGLTPRAWLYRTLERDRPAGVH